MGWINFAPTSGGAAAGVLLLGRCANNSRIFRRLTVMPPKRWI